MRTFILSITLLTLVTGALALEPVEGFLTDYQAAQAKAKKENKPLYLHFTTNWCTWCRKIENDVYKNPEGKKILTPFVKASLDCSVPEGQQPTGNVRENLTLMQKYGGQGVPTLTITSPEGDLLLSWSSYLPLPKFKVQIDKAMKRWELYKKIKQCQARGDTKSIAYNQDCLDFYLEARNFPQAAAAAKALETLDPKGEKTDPAQIAFARLSAQLNDNPDLKKIEALRKDVAKSDPENKKGYLEKAYLANVMALMVSGQRKAPAEQEALLKDMVALLQETIQKVPGMDNPMQVYGLLFQVQARLGDFDGAIQTLNTVKKLAPAGVNMSQIDMTIQKLQEAKEAKAKAEAQPKEKPAETPKDKKPAEK